MTAYDVRVESADGNHGDGVRVEAKGETAAAAAALAGFPEGWVVPEDGVSEAAGHGEAWGVDLTEVTPPGPLAE